MTLRYQNFKTAQVAAHKNLVDMVKKHAEANFLKPIPRHQIHAFAQIKKFAKDQNRPLIIDSCCGTGLSTQNLGRLFPNHAVIGIDKSHARLKRSPAHGDNILLVRGDVIDLWKLFAQENLVIKRHYLFYPNPWPKISQVKRRFHAHPIFKTMLSLAPYFELRTNWHIYADECAIALKTLGYNPKQFISTEKNFISLFEKKYLEQGCSIHVVISDGI